MQSLSSRTSFKCSLMSRTPALKTQTLAQFGKKSLFISCVSNDLQKFPGGFCFAINDMKIEAMFNV